MSALTLQNGLPAAVRITQNSRPSGSFTIVGSWQALTSGWPGNGTASAFSFAANQLIFRSCGSGLSSTFSKRMNSTRESAEIHDLVGFLRTAKLVQRVKPAKYLPSLPSRSGFCQQSMLGGMFGSGLSLMLRATGTFCGCDQVAPLSSL